MEKFNPTHEEFFNAISQMYPEQTARVVAEVRAAKMEQYINEQQQVDATAAANEKGANDGTKDGS